jgi:hypothetical protein
MILSGGVRVLVRRTHQALNHVGSCKCFLRILETLGLFLTRVWVKERFRRLSARPWCVRVCAKQSVVSMYDVLLLLLLLQQLHVSRAGLHNS